MTEKIWDRVLGLLEKWFNTIFSTRTLALVVGAFMLIYRKELGLSDPVVAKLVDATIAWIIAMSLRPPTLPTPSSKKANGEETPTVIFGGPSHNR